MGAIQCLIETPAEKELLPAYEKARAEWEVVSKRVMDGRIADTREGRCEALDLSLGKAKVKFEKMRDYLDKLTQITHHGMPNPADAIGLRW